MSALEVIAAIAVFALLVAAGLLAVTDTVLWSTCSFAS